MRAFFQGEGQRFAFLHLSGREWAGGDFGWLSQEYLDEQTAIDVSLAPLFVAVRQRGTYARSS